MSHPDAVVLIDADVRDVRELFHRLLSLMTIKRTSTFEYMITTKYEYAVILSDPITYVTPWFGVLEGVVLVGETESPVKNVRVCAGFFNQQSQNGWVPMRDDISYASGEYVVKVGNSDQEESVFIDFDGSESGIFDPGPWIRIQYRNDKYTSSNAWSNTGMSNSNNPAYSDDFSLKQSQSFINGVLDAASDVRQRFVSRGRRSTGWTIVLTACVLKASTGRLLQAFWREEL